MERFKRLITKLKKIRPKELDSKFHELHQEAFSEINCLHCANCCKTTSPIFLQSDISRISRFLKVKPSFFVEEYLKVDVDSDVILKQSPCPFLLSDNSCRIYAVRPKACREYPHTDRKRVHQVLDLSLKNSEICPAVEEIFKKLQDCHL